MASVAAELAPYVVSEKAADLPVGLLKVPEEAWVTLTEKEAKLAAALGKAAWAGSRIVLLQTSPESGAIFHMLRLALGSNPGPAVPSWKAASLAAGVSEDAWQLFLSYSATFLDSMGNYKSFGDTKFIPGIPADAFHSILSHGPGLQGNAVAQKQLQELWSDVSGIMYDLSNPRLRQLGLGEEGISSYYSPSFTKEDNALLNRWLASKGDVPQPYNSRVFKVEGGNAKAAGEAKGNVYQIWLAGTGKEEGEGAAAASPAAPAAALLHKETAEFEGHRIEVHTADYAPLMQAVCSALAEALPHAANARQEAMLKHYIRHFSTGSMEAFLAAQVEWCEDKGPIIESNIGFIESYRDVPFGVRGEWEGFVAIVDKVATAKLEGFLARAPELLALLPWGKEHKAFERETFIPPDFTALEVLNFAGSGIPAGICLPNDLSLREKHGYKNVSLANVLRSRTFSDRVTFLAESDDPLFREWIGRAFDVQVDCHELLGHGSGKLFTSSAPPPAASASAEGAAAAAAASAAAPQFNFDPASVRNPLTGEPISSWYGPGQTYDALFGNIASAMEECRAEAVGIFLSAQPLVLDLLGYAEAPEQQRSDLVYVNWLNMARAGLLGLQFYTPPNASSGAPGVWGQAHMRARFALLRVMLEAGQGFVEIVGMPESFKQTLAVGAGASAAAAAADIAAAGPLTEGQAGIHIRMDRSKIESVGLPAVGKFLLQLQVFRSTADAAGARAFFDAYTAVPDAWLPLRDLVLAKRKPRQLFVQSHMVPAAELEGVPLAEGESRLAGASQSAVVLQSFAGSAEGMLESLKARFPAQDEAFLQLWKRDFHERFAAAKGW